MVEPLKSIVSAERIRERLRNLWPQIDFIWMQDTSYVLPSIMQIEAIVAQSQVAQLRFNGELMDCDDYALLLNAYVKRRRIDMSDGLPAAESYHWAFGEAFGTKFNGIENVHTLNICLAVDGVYLIEPQTYDVRQAGAAADDILIVKM